MKKALMVTAFLVMLPAPALVMAPTPAAAAADTLACTADSVKAGAKVFKKCKACHVANKKKNRVGPYLVDVFGRTAGTAEKYRYSKAMKKAGAAGLVWNAKTLDTYLTAPKKFVPKNKMGFRGLKKQSQRTSLLCYLKDINDKAS